MKTDLLTCGAPLCNPKRYSREGADHVGIDLIVYCKTCRREGPYVECWKPTDKTRRMVNEAWNKQAAALRAATKVGDDD